MVDRLKSSRDSKWVEWTKKGEEQRERERKRVAACIFKCVECSVDVQLLFQVRQAKRGKSWYIYIYIYIHGVTREEGRKKTRRASGRKLASYPQRVFCKLLSRLRIW